MATIDIHDLTFSYEGGAQPVFEHVSLQLDTDWRLGLIGRNGRGKTTLLRLLQGQYSYCGSIQSLCRFAYFPCPVEEPSRPAGRVAAALCPQAQPWQLQRELTQLGLSEAVLLRPFAQLSGGEQTRLLLAALFLTENCFLLLDEPTDHLDAEGRRLVGRYLNGKRGFVLVSHDRALLDACVDHILSIECDSLELQRGNYSSWQQNRQRQESFERTQNERLKKEIDRLERAAESTARWAACAEKDKKGLARAGHEMKAGRAPWEGAKAKSLNRRAKAVEHRLQAAAEKKSALLKRVETAETLKWKPLPWRGGPLLQAHALAVCYDGRPLFEPIDLELYPGERLALCGPNGCGKTSLLRLVCGQPLEHTGTFFCSGALRVSRVRQDTDGLTGSLQQLAAHNGWQQSLFLAILRKLGFARELFACPVQDYSAGQKKKVLLAGSLCEQAHLLVWDEPLNGLDMAARQQLEELLGTCRPTILFVEHDDVFRTRTATRQLTLRPAAGR